MSYIEWAALGLLLVLLELFVPGMYLIWFGFAGLAVSGLVYFYTFSLTLQLILFAVFSGALAYIGFICYKKILKKSKEPEEYKNLNDLAAQHIGETVILTQEVIDGKTKVKVGDSVWMALCDENLKKGSQVTIVGVKNNLIFIVQSKK